MDWLPTFLAIAGESDIKEKLLKGYRAGNKTFKVHLDGYNLLPYLTGQETKSPRQEFFYFSDDGDLTAFRYDHWKLVFMEQRVTGTMRIWAEPFVPLRVPKLFNLRTDPYAPRRGLLVDCHQLLPRHGRRRPDPGLQRHFHPHEYAVRVHHRPHAARYRGQCQAGRGVN
jgi:arylsulfatase A-like enzyme